MAEQIANDDEWTVRGFIDIFKNAYTISNDTKIVSKVLELHLFPHFVAFAERAGYVDQTTEQALLDLLKRKN